MRILIDLQAQQGGNRHRGIGRYAEGLADAMVRCRGEHEVVLAVSGAFPETIAPIRAAYNDILPQECIQTWKAPGPVAFIDRQNDRRRRAAEEIRETFIASLHPDAVLIPSLFEGPFDDTVTSIGKVDPAPKTCVVVHDLIPLARRRTHFQHPRMKAWYQEKLAYLEKASSYLANSESTRGELVQYVRVPEARIHVIHAAAGPRFRRMQLSRTEEAALRRRFGLSRPFLMYTGGIEPRKNLEGLIRAYARLPDGLRRQHQLAIVCAVQPVSRALLRGIAHLYGLRPGEIVLTGFVTDADLVRLYNLCKAFVFPSWHEGFGLPLLEAMSCGKAAIAANTTSLPEIMSHPDALFDPYDPGSIALRLTQLLTDQDYRDALERYGYEQARTFSWQRSAGLAWDAIKGISLHTSLVTRS